MKKLNTFFLTFIQSPRFLVGVLAFFVIEASWFALTAQYPMAFDENYHFGIIQIYSHQWLPFITKNPPGSSAYGDLTRYDSYLYHYLMSFPYRIIELFTSNQTVQIIALRFVNILLFLGGLLLFSRLLKRFNFSRAIINFSILFLVLIPVVPFLAATINYDNLVFLIVPMTVGFTYTCVQAIQKSNKIPAIILLLLLITGGLGSLVKYAFAPIFVACLIYLIITYIRHRQSKELIKSFVESFKKASLLPKILIIIGIAITIGLLGERYGVNIVKYHSIEPDCSRIQTIQSCLQYGPWGRNYNIKQSIAQYNPQRDPSIGLFLPVWIGGMMMRLFFAINYNYANYPPLPIPITVTSVLGGVGIILLVIYRKHVRQLNKNILLLGVVVGLYILSLFYVNFSEYLKYRTPLAINGRYLIIVLPLFLPTIGYSFSLLARKISAKKNNSYIGLFGALIIVLMLQGGGALTHLVRSQPDWYWPNKTVKTIDINAKNIASSLIIGKKYK